MSEITELAARRLLIDYTRDMALSDEEPERIVGRTLTDDAVWITDGTELTRDQLIAHATPARKNVTASDMRIDDLLIDGRRFAARCCLSAQHRKLGHAVIEWLLIGEVAEDGRIRRIHQLGHTPVTDSETGE
ncbi:nuclear transport factor 2 family protein [Streptomyces sp. H39-C1]|uniref:nuclear transport factor 2 family protein n=1 Tax=Streptomyces sp. H39-C1 TaxID=3004355 RepID=UPI0022AE67F0|nr:nuclear transport factor 2 family protein [Streptomyces sp. H39-C1]MCZ4101101.1 nuclear transport factor 2 family protein [Streptomyces sp. H39-C1]